MNILNNFLKDLNNNLLLNYYMLIAFPGSVFLTSGKFVNEINAPKYYFIAICFFLIVAVVAAWKNRIYISNVFFNKSMLWWICIICFLQASYGISQLIGFFSSNHTGFEVTGSYENPAGFAAVLAIGFPIGLCLFEKAKKYEKIIAGAVLMVIISAIFFSGSRAGILAIVISSFIYILFQKNIINKIRGLKYYKLLLVLISFAIIGAGTILYYQKKDSADGRLLVWDVASVMIKEKPLFGHGYGAFQAKYMDYQAEYFKNNPDSKYKLLADNIMHPFNEFINRVLIANKHFSGRQNSGGRV